MTEEQAQEKICPFISVGKTCVNCVGAACMAWREYELNDIDSGGYCGMAGKAGKE